MDKQVDISKYLIPLLQDYEEFKAISDAINPELEQLWKEIDRFKNNQYIHTSDEYGIKRREKICRIIPKETESLDDRKFRLLAKEVDKLPYTKRSLHRKLSSLCGEDGYYLNIDYNNYTVDVGLTIDSTSNIDSVKNILDEIIPENMIIHVFVDIKLEFNNIVYLPSIVCSNKEYTLSCDFNESHDINSEIIAHNIVTSNDYIELH